MKYLKFYFNFLNESYDYSNDNWYHGNRKGDFPPEKMRFAGGCIFLTSNLNFAKGFAGLNDEDEKQPTSSVFQIWLKQGLKICNPFEIETMKELDLFNLIKGMIDNKYKDELGGINFGNELKGEGFKGYDYITNKEFDLDVTNKDNWPYFYLWRFKNGSWRLIETTPVIEKIKSKGYNGFIVVEGNNKNLAIFDKNSILKFEKII